MIRTAEEFKQLRESEIPEEFNRAAREEASIVVWKDILKKYPELAFWVAQNKSIQIEILIELAKSPDSNVRCMVARKRKITYKILDLLKEDNDESVRHALICNTKVTVEQKMTIRTDDSEWLKKELKEKIKMSKTHTLPTKRP